MDFRLADWSLSSIFDGAVVAVRSSVSNIAPYIWWWQHSARMGDANRGGSVNQANLHVPSNHQEEKRKVGHGFLLFPGYFSCLFLSSMLHRSQASVHIEQSSSRVSLFVCFFCLLLQQFRSLFCLKWVKEASTSQRRKEGTTPRRQSVSQPNSYTATSTYI